MLIGKTIWRFDINRRVYSKKNKGPIYREHWVPINVIGETSRSWLYGSARKPYRVPKNGPHPGFALTQEEVDEDCWANENRRYIVNMVERCPLDVLKRVAEVVGYHEPKL